MKYFSRARLSVFALVPAAFLMVGNVLAQELQQSLKIDVSDEDRVAAATTTNVRFHLFLTKQAKAAGMSPDSANVKFALPAHPPLPITTLPTPPTGTFFYPDDVEKVVSTGNTIHTAVSHPIYINCVAPSTPTTCWGNPAAFLTDLGASNMIHITDQYTGLTTNGRYTVGAAVNTTLTIFAGTSGTPTLGENDILSTVHAAAKTLGSGLGEIYHVFIPKGVDTCMDEGSCYSPDNAATFAFCAYHFRVKFSDLANPVYYTVEPFQGPLAAPLNNLCTIPFTTPNGPLVDSMATSLLHETFETITDPDINTGFRAINSSFGEVGDVCEGTIFNPISFNGHNFATQAIYSDKFESCATTP
jgi:hypothetical protein